MATQAETVNCLGAICATCEILRFSENLENHWKKQRFEHLHQVARKNRPVDAGGRPRNRPGHHKNHWENIVFAHGHTGGTVNCLGAIYATCEILRFSENLGKRWKNKHSNYTRECN